MSSYLIFGRIPEELIGGSGEETRPIDSFSPKAQGRAAGACHLMPPSHVREAFHEGLAREVALTRVTGFS